MKTQNLSFLAASDLHLESKLFNMPELAQDLMENLSKLVDLAIQLKVRWLVLAGDTFDSTKPTPESISFAKEEFYRASLHGIETVGIAGDHDIPINGYSWLTLCGVKPVDSVPQFAGRDYTIQPEEVDRYLREKPNKEDVKFIFLHGQEQALFKYVEEKKRLNFKDFPIFELYPNLVGIILGDIHKPFEGAITDKGKKAYIGYCGSLGIVKSDEIGTKTGVLHWNGTELKRVPFKLDRDFHLIDFRGENVETFDVKLYIDRYANHTGKKPVFRIEYDKLSNAKIEKLAPLYQVGLVKPIQQKVVAEGGEEETVNIRTELSTSDRIANTLRKICEDDSLYNPTLELVTATEGWEAVLDKLKVELFETNTA